MKTLTRMLTTAALILVGVAVGRQAAAAPTVTWSYELVSGPATDPTSSSDLVNAGQSTLSSVSSSGNVAYYPGGSLSKANDGAYGGFNAPDLNPTNNSTVTFTLNTTTNTNGYDIWQIVSYAGYGADGRRAYQYYDVAVHTVGMAPGTFTAVVSTGAKGYNSGGPEWTRMSVGDGGYVLASGVDQIKFTFHPGIAAGGGEQPGGFYSDYYHEIDVFGAPSYVPPSGSGTPSPARNITPTLTWSLAAPTVELVTSTDLVNRVQSSWYPNVMFSGSVDFSTSPGALNDGSFGPVWNWAINDIAVCAPVDGSAVTYSLNTAVNRLGYDIKQIVSVASYCEARRAYQTYDVAVHYVGTPAETFVALSSFINLGYFSGAPGWTQVKIGNGSAVMAYSGDRIRFTFHNSPAAGGSGYGVSIYREIDVFGSPAIAGTVIVIQ